MARPIHDTLRLINGGTFLDECAERLAESVRAVEETGKAGKVSITLDLKKAGGAIAVSGKVTNKAPEPKPDETLLWATVEGNLVPDNPAQHKLEFREVAKGPSEMRDVQRTGS